MQAGQRVKVVSVLCKQRAVARRDDEEWRQRLDLSARRRAEERDDLAAARQRSGLRRSLRTPLADGRAVAMAAAGEAREVEKAA